MKAISLFSGAESEKYHRRYQYSFNDWTMYIFYGRGCINSSGTAISCWVPEENLVTV